MIKECRAKANQRKEARRQQIEECNDAKHQSQMRRTEKGAEMEMKQRLMAASHVAARHFRESQAPACERLGLHRSGKSADAGDGGKRSIRGELDKLKLSGKWTGRHRVNCLSLTEMEQIIRSNTISPARII